MEFEIDKGFTRCKANPGLYSKCRDGKWVYLLHYVDDLIIAHKEDEEIAKMSQTLNKHFKNKDLWNMFYSLGFKVQRKKDESFQLNQSTNIDFQTGPICLWILYYDLWFFFI